MRSSRILARYLSSATPPAPLLLRPLIGLEVHAQLQTATKLFTSSPTTSSSAPNTNLSPFDLSLPGTLPVLSPDAVRLALTASLALSSTINNVSIFERKHYFYPDSPHNYQVTQNRWPVASGGRLDFEGGSTEVTRVQIETDTGKMTGALDAQGSAQGVSNIDYNRAGCGLIEIVFEPDIDTCEGAGRAVKQLQMLLKHTGVCDGRFEEGSMRVDLNVSVYEEGKFMLNNRVEVKNINSLKAIVSAAEFEYERQKKIVEAGGTVAQETRMFDKVTGVTKVMRRKEDMLDYRFMPEPDLPPLVLDRFDGIDLEDIRRNLAELPELAKLRLKEQYEDVTDAFITMIVDEGYVNYFDECLRHEAANSGLTATYLCNEVFMLRNEFGARFEMENGTAMPPPVTPAQLGDIVKKVEAGDLSKKMGKDLFKVLFLEEERGADVDEVVVRRGLVLERDLGVLMELCLGVVHDERYAKQLVLVKSAENDKKKGKMVKFFFGKVMAESKGMADVSLLKEALDRVIEKL